MSMTDPSHTKCSYTNAKIQLQNYMMEISKKTLTTLAPSRSDFIFYESEHAMH